MLICDKKNVVFARIYEGKRQSERKREMREEKEAVAGGGKPVAWRPRSLSGPCAGRLPPRGLARAGKRQEAGRR